MWPVFPAQQTLLAILALFLLTFVSVRLIHPAWWRSRPIRLLTLAPFALMLSGVALWSLGISHSHVPSIRTGALLAYSTMLIVTPAAVLLPLSALLHRLLSRRSLFPVACSPFPVLPVSPLPVACRPSPVARSSLLSRRALLSASSLSVPALAAATSARGLLSADSPPRIPLIRMRYDNLHPDLDGLRILQLSDLHLGACAGLDDLARGLDAAVSAQRPDLIVLTGDLADDIQMIPGALDLIARARARHGALASLGNHEYLHDIAATRPKFEASAVPLLVSTGRTLTIGRAKLFVGGADDPVHMKGDIARMLRPSIMRAAAHAPGDADFRLLLCHRPEGFVPAVDAGFDLTLAGHTHGGQIGLFGRSILEKLSPGTGWWGTYARARAQMPPARLYTTSGFGHWFPFRVGCPTEMPIIVLERSAPGMTSLSRRA